MSYRMRIDPRARNAGRFTHRVQKELQEALARSGLKQQQVAEKLGVDKSLVNRRFTGRANLTLRSIADLAWAMDHDIVFRLKPRTLIVGINEPLQKSSSLAQSKGTSPATVSTQSAAGFQSFDRWGTEPASVQTKNKVTQNTVLVPQHEVA